MTRPQPIEVAIVGGGCAGITTAFELTRPEHQGKYHVTLYQMGWRLGGKGASGRGVSGRIEEHGLHLWMGFYENAFRLLRECYAELDRDPASVPIAHWKDAFTRDPYVGVADQNADGQWRCWSTHFPAGAGDPGDPLTDQNPFTVNGYIKRAVALLRALINSIQTQSKNERSNVQDDQDQGTATDASPMGIERLLKMGSLATITALLEGLTLLELTFEKLPVFPTQTVLQLIRAIRIGTHAQVVNLIKNDDELRRLWEMIDVVLACLHGAVRYDLMTRPEGFDAINDYDWREWLILNGASESSVNSAFMRGIYDLLFAYEDGDTNKPRLAAGQALRGAVRMFLSYRGALFWKMRAGMGDVVFAPFYEVLKARGVTFNFFHRLDDVRLSDNSTGTSDSPHVAALEMTIQARPKADKDYNPLIDVKGLPCWPSQPDYAQLVAGDEYKQAQTDFESPFDTSPKSKKDEKLTLRVTRDFDYVVLAVGFGAIPHVCRELVDTNPDWQAAVQNVTTVPTQAFQIWMREDMAALGWHKPPINLSGFVTPFDTWADMTHLCKEECWSDEPKSIAYFCSVLPDTGDRNAPDKKTRRQEVHDNAIRFLESDIRHLWPAAVTDKGTFRFNLLIDACENHTDAATSDESAFQSQFWTANVMPSDRYVQSLPGSLKYRISPLDNTYDNLTVAGDWTDCSHNAGCVEAAVMSGRLAAHALSQKPLLEEIVGFDHP